ncbi:hypothetical protein TrVFT333_002492 [Trichoderma virens FT-333]|nr:hypothetical protein TrVFT333_002492 [Trichoderma virens FT-333]
MSFSQTDEYSTKATSQYLSARTKIISSATASNIGFGQTDQVDKKWFSFSNAVACDILLNLKMESQAFLVICISPMLVALGITTLTPVSEFIFWFQDAVSTSTMSTHFRGESITVKPSLIDNNNSKICYTKEGHWKTLA